MKKSFRSTVVILIVVIFIIITRIIFLDSDIPIPQVTEYVPIDEMYYNHAAFNLFHYGEFTHQIIPYINDDGTPKNIFENIVTAFTLGIWGNNYYGLRLASVLAALLIVLFFYLFLKKIFFKENADQIAIKSRNNSIIEYVAIFLAMIYLMIDFSFLIASRVAEPTIFRMLAMLFLMFLMSSVVFMKEKIPYPLTFLLGFFSFSSVLFVYFYNFFIFCAIGLTIIIWAWPTGWKNAARQVIIFCLGAAFCVLAYKLFCQYVYNVTFYDVFQDLMSFKSRMAGNASGFIAGPKHYLTNFLSIFSTNIFRLNSAILFLFLVSLPAFIMNTFKEKNKLVVLSANLLLFLFLQSIVINDFNFRKLVILLPLVIISILVAYSYKDEFFASLEKNSIMRKLFVVYWIGVGYFFVFFMHLGSIKPKMINPGIIINSQAVIPYDINRVNLAVFLFVFAVLTMKYFSNKGVNKIIAIIALAALFIPNIYTDFRYVYLNPTYNFRDTMIELKDKVDGKVVAGGCAFGLRLYNDSIPLLDFYPYVYSTNPESKNLTTYRTTLTRLFRENKADYSVQFTYAIGSNEKKYMDERGFEIEGRYGMATLYKSKLK